MARIKVGDFEIISIVDLESPFPMAGVFPDVPAEAFEPYRPLYPGAFQDDALKLAISGYVISGGGRTILVDTGLGPNMNPEIPGQLVTRLKTEGFGPEDIDTVIFTHLHLDHVGWNFQDGKATFPRCRYVVQQVDWDYFSVQTDDPVVAAQVVPLGKTGALELVSGETQFTPEITLVPTPGHTPGHQSVVVSSGGDHAFIAGDVSHHPAQAQETAWKVGFDVDPEQASATRASVMDRLERDGHSACFGHYPAPGFGLIVREGSRRIFRAL
jgi:glyoxylase-like metal-dependent hydrolase (beta-lactamase superfamily II)